MHTTSYIETAPSQPELAAPFANRGVDANTQWKYEAATTVERSYSEKGIMHGKISYPCGKIVVFVR